MGSDDELTERLRRLGLRVGRDALSAFLAHVHKSRLRPTETVEQLVDLEERARVAVNLQRRTRFACLGPFKMLDRFDWTTPRRSIAFSSSSSSSTAARTSCSRAARASAR